MDIIKNIQSGNAYSIGSYGWNDIDTSIGDVGSHITFGWFNVEWMFSPVDSGLTEDPTFEYLYVHPGATGKGNGLCWYDAFTSINTALSYLQSGCIFTKYIDLSNFGGTGIICSSGAITKLAIATGCYNEDIKIMYHDDDWNITLQGGFDPGWPLTSGYLELTPDSGYPIINSVGTGFYVYNQESTHYLKRLQFISGLFPVRSVGSYIDIDDVIVSGGRYPLSFTSRANFNVNNVTLFPTGVGYLGHIGGIYSNISTGTISNSTINSGFGYGITEIGGKLNCYNNTIIGAGTGIYFNSVNNNTSTENLLEYNHVGIYAEDNFSASYNTIYGDIGLKLNTATGYINNSIIHTTGHQFELNGGSLLINNGCLYTPGNYLSGNYTNTGTLMLSGDILYDDPKFVIPESGDFRLDITSRCIGKAEIIRDETYKRFPITAEYVRIQDDYGFQDIKTYRNEIKVIDNSVIYINPISGYDDEVTVLVNENKTISDTIKGISSFDIESGAPNKYPYDYKIISRFNYKKNSYDYYLIPYTIFEIKPFLTKYVNDPDKMLSRLNKDNLSVETQYNFANITYDNQHGYDTANNESLYVLERNNQYLIKSDKVKGTELKRYYLMRPDPTGSYYKPVVYPSGLNKHQEVTDGYEFLTQHYQDSNKTIKDSYITCLNKEGAIKWLPTDVDRDPTSGYIYRDLRGLMVYDGDLYYLALEGSDDIYKYQRILKPGNKTQLIKVDLDDQISLEKILTGQMIEMQNPAGFTINRDNKLVVVNYDQNPSGHYYINEYKMCYDYALVDRNNDNTNKILFREEYPHGVNI